MTLLQVCDRFHCLPSEALNESASVLRLLKIEGIYKEARGEAESYGSE